MYSLFVLIIELIILNLTRYYQRNEAFIVFLIILFSIAFVVDISSGEITSKFQIQINAAYMLRLSTIWFDLKCRSIYSLPNSGADSEWFYRQGVAYVTGKNTVSGPFYTLLGITFKTIGISRLYMQFLLMLLSMVAIIYAAKTMELLYIDTYNKKIAMYILCLLPNYTILSSIFLRESIVSMFVAISFYHFIRWYKNTSIIDVLLAFISILIGSMFHSGIMGMALGYIMILVLNRENENTIVSSVKQILLAIGISVGFVYLMNNYSELFFGKMLKLINDPTIESVANVLQGGGSSYAQYVGNSNSIKNILIYTPVRMFFFLGSPFVWQIRGISDIIALLFNSLFYLYVLYRAFKYVITTSNRFVIVPYIIIILLSTAFVFSWGVTNTGTAIRHRDKMATVYAVLLALTGGFEPRNHSEHLYIK